MSASSPAAWRGTLAGLIAFHIFIIIASNYLVQLPITLFGWHTTWGAFSFPFIFLATDLTVRLLGKGPARLVIARVMIPALIASYVVSVLFQEAAFRGFSALLEFNTFVARISLASFLAYVLGQILDIQVFVSVWPTHLPDPSCSRHGVHLFLVDTISSPLQRISRAR
ncbi:queuosine precursor transporter, partial [Pseudomonas aeruginosa]|uniref:queuosine precursor transporter n=1 Tax=Pseudomonas aeruginosa TaxID=287 RepID=UPI003A4E581B